jgi:hypothetical protein
MLFLGKTNMPEDQSIIANEWNRRLNIFLGNVMRWSQIGESNTDIYCDSLRRKVGIDSVFIYQRNQASYHQVVFVEAKTVEKLDNISRAKIEEWANNFQDKIANIPLSPDFSQKFNPPSDSEYHLGIIALWVRENGGYSREKLSLWLSQLNLPQRRQNPINILFVSNFEINILCQIHTIIEELGKECEQISFQFPIYGNLPSPDGSCIPAEYLISKFFFVNVKRKKKIDNGNFTTEYQDESKLVFYLGAIKSYDDLRFIGLALRQFQLLANQNINIYILIDPIKIRNEIQSFNSEFSDSSCKFEFYRFSVPNDLPGWLDYDK